MRNFRFGFLISRIQSRDALMAKCRIAERFGYDIALVPDHLGVNRVAPFPMMVALANASEQLRVGSFVLNAGFYNPSLLAREVSTTDQATDRRVDLGLGAGYMKAEFDAAAIPWRQFSDRTLAVTALIDELELLYANQQDGSDATPTPLPPLMIGGTGDRMLRLAGERADIVAFGGIFQVKGQPPGTFRIGTASEMEERVRFFNEQAGARAGEIERNVLVQRVVVTSDRRSAAEQVRAEYCPELTVDDVLIAPVFLIGTVQQIADQLQERRAQFGFTYIAVQHANLEDFGPVIDALHG